MQHEHEPVVSLEANEVSPVTMSRLHQAPEHGEERSVGRGDDNGGDTSSAHSMATTIATKTGCCQDALKVLSDLEALRQEEGGGTRAGSFEWLEDNGRSSTVYELLASVPAINSLDSVFRRKLLPRLELVRFGEGEVVFHQGDQQDTVSGRLRVYCCHYTLGRRGGGGVNEYKKQTAQQYGCPL